MAKKKNKNKQVKPTEERTTPTSTRVMQIIFVIFSVMIVLSMILSATASFY